MDILYKDVYLEIYKYCDYLTQISFSYYLADIGIYVRIRYPNKEDCLELINADIQTIKGIIKTLHLSTRCIILLVIKYSNNIDKLDYLLKEMGYQLTFDDLVFPTGKEKPDIKLLRGIHDKYGYCFNVRSNVIFIKRIMNLLYQSTDTDCIFCKDFASILLDENSHIRFTFNLIPIKKNFVNKSIYKLKWNLLYL